MRKLILLSFIIMYSLGACNSIFKNNIGETVDTPSNAEVATRKARSEEIEYNKKVSAKIISALENYRYDKNNYPNQLLELVPSYIIDLPQTMNKEDFIYEIDGKSYALVFEIKNSLNSHGKYCTYIERLKFWDCDYGSGDTKK